MPRVEDIQFAVDTGLFRQLGELLVGRDATALVELIKNAYDADATSVQLTAEHLDSPDAAVIRVIDNGSGMTEQQFRRGFLTLAARSKTTGDRRSPIYSRRYTGEKGVGRLAAHKLAALLDVSSIAALDGRESAVTTVRTQRPDISSQQLLDAVASRPTSLVRATIDWDKIEAAETLQNSTEGLILDVDTLRQRRLPGTNLRLSRLRHKWTTQDIRDLARQLGNFEAPSAFSKQIPRAVRDQPILFKEPITRDAGRDDPGIHLELDGDFSSGEEYWPQVERSSLWVMEMRARRHQETQFALTPTPSGLSANPYSRALQLSAPHPDPTSGPFFDARVWLRPGTVAGPAERDWAVYNSGVRVYLEGFRVLPYGEPGNDWLALDFDYTRRSGRYEINPLLAGPGEDLSALRSLSQRDVSLRMLPNRAFFGAVFLTEEGAGGLRTLVNREGFVPDVVYERLVEIVRSGINVLLRSWALAGATQKRAQANAARSSKSASEAEEASSGTESGGASSGPGETESTRETDAGSEQAAANETSEAGADEDTQEVDEWSRTSTSDSSSRQSSGARLLEAIATLRTTVHEIVGGITNEGTDTPTRVLDDLSQVEAAASAVLEDASLLRVLGSVGTQLSTFTHEVAQLIPRVREAQNLIEPAKGQRLSPNLVQARRVLDDLRRALERQTSYLTDVATTEARRRRSRQKLHERTQLVLGAFETTAAALGIELANKVPEDLRTPPLFLSELQGILNNLVSNAIKAVGTEGVVSVDASLIGDRGVMLSVSNTGIAVDPQEAEQWFQPYASTSTSVDPILGQGMGLGLPITRSLVSEYGGSVRFVKPRPGFATTIEVVIPE